ISYPIIHTVEKGVPTALGTWPLYIRCHNFVFLWFSFTTEAYATGVYETIQKLTCVGSVTDLYAFFFKPLEYPVTDGWKIYDPKAEYERMGIDNEGSQWRFTHVNESYTFSPTYPHIFVVPTKISDTVLQYAAKYRSKARIPALSYLHWLNKASITRCSQPMVGIKQNRSIQDEKLIEAIFMTTVEPLKDGQRVYSNTATNLIIDARPTANAVVNTAVGAGTENMENYRNCKKSYAGIENIHVMRESLNKLVEALQELDQKGRISKAALQRSGWLKHIATLMDGANMIVRNIHVNSSHVLVHCSDGWDRTAQLTSIAQVCLDPYYRTLRGFQVLVEKEWCSFGHKFMDRCGHLSNDKNFVSLSATNSAANTFANVQSKLYNNKHIRETSPVFQQFLDSVFQIMYQFPTRFEFNEDFLIQLHYHVYSCQFGNFLFNCERERVIRYQAAANTQSLWDYLNANKELYLNPQFDPSADRINEGDQGVLFPDTKAVRYWAKLFNRNDNELNGLEDTPNASGERAIPEAQELTSSYTEANLAVPVPDLSADVSIGGIQDGLEGRIGAGPTFSSNGAGGVPSPSLSPSVASEPTNLGTILDSRLRPNSRGGRTGNFSESLTSDDAWNAAKASAVAIGGGIVDTFSRLRESFYAPSAPSPGPSSSSGPSIGDSDNGGAQGIGNGSAGGGPLGGLSGIGGVMFGQRNRSATLGRSQSNRRKGTVDRELTSVAGHTPKPAFEDVSTESSPRLSLASLTLESEINQGRTRAAPASRTSSPAPRLDSAGGVNGVHGRTAGVRSPRAGSPAPGALISGGGARGFDPLSNPATFAPLSPPSPPTSPSPSPAESRYNHPLETSANVTSTTVSASVSSVLSSNGSKRGSLQSSKSVTVTTITQETPTEEVAVATALVSDLVLTSTDATVTPPVAPSPPVKELPHPLFIE
ncbi:hypothetical protein BGW41_005150, partial [Actinomortierella wolfii]